MYIRYAIQYYLPTASVVVRIDSRYEYQPIMGFGGAFTDAAGINIDSLPEVTQEVLLRLDFWQCKQ